MAELHTLETDLARADEAAGAWMTLIIDKSF